ncbi:hypothetical protein SNE40_009026 [Patella caerulea]|uniref:Uncharacterized protein n=1 Tax=Patella caerulea TaxID=87958 RepID=A0AAN8PPK2_PATCE
MSCSRYCVGALLGTFVAFFLTVVGMATRTWHKDGLNKELWETYYVDEDNYDFSGIPVSTQVCLGMSIMIGLLSFVCVVIVLCKRTKGMQTVAVVSSLLAGLLVFIGVGILVPYLSPRFGYSFYLALSGGILDTVSGILMLVDMRMVPDQ